MTETPATYTTPTPPLAIELRRAAAIFENDAHGQIADGELMEAIICLYQAMRMRRMARDVEAAVDKARAHD